MAWSLIINSLVGILAGVIIGLERQWQKKLAGIRTTALVSLGACMFVTFSTLFISDGSPTRIAAQVVSGVGFLAGGVIIRDGYSVTGINTAATLWCSAAVGSIIGGGFMWEGLICAVLLMFMNIMLRGLSNQVNHLRFHHKPDTKQYHFSVVCPDSDEIKVRTFILNALNQNDLNFNQIICAEPFEGKVTIFVDLDISERDANAEVRIKAFTEKLLLKKNVLEVQRVGADMD